jgi:cell division protease FtsH
MSDPDFDEFQGHEENRPASPWFRGLVGWLLIGGLTLLAVWAVMRWGESAREFSRDDLENLLAKPDALKEFCIRGDVVHGKIKPEYLNEFGGPGAGADFTVHLQVYEVKPFIERVAAKKELLRAFKDEKNRSFIPEDPFMWQALAAAIPWVIILIGLWIVVSRQMRAASGPGGVLSFGRSRAKLVKKERVKVTFADVAGIDDAKEEVQEIVEFLRHPQRFQVLGGRIPHGVMLVGPPGTGKTLLAKAIAGEADVPFFSISGSDFVEMFVGVGASRVRDLFRMAKESSPCIVFLDEIDAVGRRRTHEVPGGGQETSQTLNAILVEMDGFDTNEQVIVIGATNRPDVLDPALRRPGRFDREVMVHLPDYREREAILDVHAKKIKLADQVDLGAIARGTPGFSGADLAALTNESAIRATLLNKAAVEQADLEEARDKTRWGRAKRSRAMDEHDRRLAAYHEAGHVLMSLVLEPDVEPLHKVSIIPRGQMLGATMFLPEKDKYTVSRRQCVGQIKVAFAGRIAEEIVFNDITSGAADDIRQATQVARRMVCDWGMSERLGPIRYAANDEMTLWGSEFLGAKEHSDATARDIDDEVQTIVQTSYAHAKDLLLGNREVLERIAEALLKKEVLTADEVRHEIAGLPLQKPAAPPPGEATPPTP